MTRRPGSDARPAFLSRTQTCDPGRPRPRPGQSTRRPGTSTRRPGTPTRRPGTPTPVQEMRLLVPEGAGMRHVAKPRRNAAKRSPESREGGSTRHPFVFTPTGREVGDEAPTPPRFELHPASRARARSRGHASSTFSARACHARISRSMGAPRRRRPAMVAAASSPPAARLMTRSRCSAERSMPCRQAASRRALLRSARARTTSMRTSPTRSSGARRSYRKPSPRSSRAPRSCGWSGSSPGRRADSASLCRPERPLTR